MDDLKLTLFMNFGYFSFHFTFSHKVIFFWLRVEHGFVALSRFLFYSYNLFEISFLFEIVWSTMFD